MKEKDIDINDSLQQSLLRCLLGHAFGTMSLL